MQQPYGTPPDPIRPLRPPPPPPPPAPFQTTSTPGSVEPDTGSEVQARPPRLDLEHDDPGLQAPSPTAASVSLDPDIRAQLPRGSTRTTLSFDSPGRLILPEQQTVFVTLHDISRSGCCVSRKGLLEAHPGDRVTIEMWREKIETKESFKAVICWVRHHERSTRVGLRFLDTSARTLRAVDAYLRSSARPGA